MIKIPSLFRKDWTGNRLVYNEVLPGTEWVLQGQGIATIKFDGTACLLQNGILYKRYDRKIKRKYRQQIINMRYIPKEPDFKSPPNGWFPAEPCPDKSGTYHWFGWLPVSESNPADKWHIESYKDKTLEDGTYELVGPKIQGNPYYLDTHELWKHGSMVIENVPFAFSELEVFLDNHKIEGIVWHHKDGRMAKIKRTDFGLNWPVPEEILDMPLDK